MKRKMRIMTLRRPVGIPLKIAVPKRWFGCVPTGYHTIKQAAKKLGVCESTIRLYARHPRMPEYRLPSESVFIQPEGKKGHSQIIINKDCFKEWIKNVYRPLIEKHRKRPDKLGECNYPLTPAENCPNTATHVCLDMSIPAHRGIFNEQRWATAKKYCKLHARMARQDGEKPVLFHPAGNGKQEEGG